MILRKGFRHQVFNEETNALEEEMDFEQIEFETPPMYKFLIFLQIFLTVLGTGGMLASIVCGAMFLEELLLLLVPSFLVILITSGFGELRDDWLKSYAEKYRLWAEKELYWECKTAREIGHAEAWREAHPLEEKCRLAMTKNPNYVADLIRYVKEGKEWIG